jgi:hypothetical protein
MSDPGSGSDADNSDDLATDIVGVEQYAFTVPPKKDFLPWHRPRKQFVRNDQWRYQISVLLDEIQSEGTLTYFGLPGVDLLDLRFFGSTICEPRNLKLRFLGFNNGADPKSEEQTELNISLDEISKSASFDPQSEIIPDDIRELVNEESIAWQKTFELSPYDVVNLDLCDGFGAQAPGQINETYYNAVSKLLTVQMRKKSPWLLLLTTRVGKEHVHAETLTRLSNLYNTNLMKCAPFRKASAETFKIGDREALQKAKQQSAGIQSVFLVGLCKWLLHFGVAQNPPSIMAVKSVLGYRVKKGVEVEDMISIALRFDPTHGPIKDPSNLASIKPTKLDECDLATDALKKVAKLFDVDAYLSSEKSIRDEMIEAMCGLLESARYDVDEYRKWIET